MQGKHLYEYAVIRLVPRVEREEFFNVGIILFSKRAKYIKALYKVDENKLNLFSSELDRESLFANLHVFDKICSGTKEGGPIAALDVPERFRWLTAVRVHLSRLHVRIRASPTTWTRRWRYCLGNWFCNDIVIDSKQRFNTPIVPLQRF